MELKHNPLADHNCLQPCVMIEAMARGLDDTPIGRASLDFLVASIKTLFDTSRHDLCYGGLAPWEQQEAPKRS